MRKIYVAPELEELIFDVTDIITHSLVTDGNENSTPFDDDWIGGGDESGDISIGDDDDVIIIDNEDGTYTVTFNNHTYTY